MIPVTNAFKNAIVNDNKDYIIKIEMTLHDGTKLTLDNADIWESGISFEEATSSTSSFDIGAVVIGKCQIVLNNIYEKFSPYDFFNAALTLWLGLNLGDTTEMIRKGFYTVDEPKYNGSLITLSCLDNMWKFDVPYSEVATVYPATIGVIIADICLYCGVPLGKANFPNYNYVIQARPDDELNCREVISYLAQISCLYARISNSGALVMQWYEMHTGKNINGGYFDDGTPLYKSGDDLYGGNFDDWSSGDDYNGGTFEDWEKVHMIRSSQSMSVSTDDIVIKGIRIKSDRDDGYDVLYGTDEYVLVIENNPFVNADNAEEIASYVGGIIVGMYFRPFTASVLNDVTMEAGDMCVINDFRGNIYNSYITNLSFTLGNYESLSCGAETPSRNKTVRYSDGAKTTAQIRAETQEQISTYGKAIQNMNELAANAMGLFQEREIQEDGSEICYESNKPITVDENGKCHFVAGSIVYKRTGDGFFVSNDGGKDGSFIGGFDSNMNAVVNVLSAIGIAANWIQTGRLVAQKGGNTTFLVDVDTGEVQIVADSFSLTSGDTIDSIAEDKAKTAADNALDDANEYTDSASKKALDSAKAYADSASKNAVNAQTQQDIFNKLTNNGQAKGIFLRDGQLYISFTYAQGGALTLGGSDNTNGILQVLDSAKNTVGYWDNNNFFIKSSDYIAATYSKTQNFQIFKDGNTHWTNLYLKNVGDYFIVEFADDVETTLTVTFFVGSSTSLFSKTFSVTGRKIKILMQDLINSYSKYITKIESSSNGIKSIGIYSATSDKTYDNLIFFEPNTASTGSSLMFGDNLLEIGTCRTSNGYYIGNKKLGSVIKIGKIQNQSKLTYGIDNIRKFSSIHFFLKTSNTIGCIGNIPAVFLTRDVYDEDLGGSFFFKHDSITVQISYNTYGRYFSFSAYTLVGTGFTYPECDMILYGII